MQSYYLLLRDHPDTFAKLSPTEIQAVIQRYVTWRNENSKHVTGGSKLADGQGRVVRKNGDGLTVSDGPFVEAKEILGGFFVVDAEDYDGALAIARTCPHLEFGSIEVRLVEPTP